MFSSHAPGTMESDKLDLSFLDPFLVIRGLSRGPEESRIGAWLMRGVSPAGKPDEVIDDSNTPTFGNCSRCSGRPIGTRSICGIAMEGALLEKRGTRN